MIRLSVPSSIRLVALSLLVVFCIGAAAAPDSRRANSDVKGDINGDGIVNAADVVSMVNYIMGKQSAGFNVSEADINKDGVVNVTDAVAVVNLVVKDFQDEALFRTAENARQYLVNLYHMQRHGLPHATSMSYPKFTNSSSVYTGHLDALTDCYQMHWDGSSVYTNYYYGGLSASGTPLISFNKDWVWETVSMAWRMIENLYRAKDLDQAERDRMIAEAKCLIAVRYFDLLPYYGGLPIIRDSESETAASAEKPRATFEETVDFMVGLLDEAIPAMAFAKDDSRAESDGFNRFWTAGGAMALKAKILLLAASPLFNNTESYYDGTTEAETKHLVWYGNYDAARWQRALKACEDFFKANGESDPMSATLGTEGIYHLLMSASAGPYNYRQAYRMGYISMTSPEVIHSNRAYCNWNQGTFGEGGREEGLYGMQASYAWWPWISLGRNSYLPTEEYVEMFPMSDGKPFEWTDNNKSLFFTYGARGLKTPSRDPRLYENAIVPGMQKTWDGNTSSPSGSVYELWVGGSDAAFSVADNNGNIVEKLTASYSSGYGVMKYYLGEEYRRQPLHFVVLSYDEMLLMYAECLAQTGNLEAALNCVNRVRARVGLGTMESFNESLKTNSEQLLAEILRERACELGMSGNRYFDLVRYKHCDWMTTPLHGLLTYWTNSMGSNVMSTNNGADPRSYSFSRFEMINRRSLWGVDPTSLKVRKMLLWPFPVDEMEKNYGLVQNPGW